MLEIPCTLRCDRCKQSKAVTITARVKCPEIKEATDAASVAWDALTAFVISSRELPSAWELHFPRMELLCPDCSGAL